MTHNLDIAVTVDKREAELQALVNELAALVNPGVMYFVYSEEAPADKLLGDGPEYIIVNGETRQTMHVGTLDYALDTVSKAVQAVRLRLDKEAANGRR
jgi:hypothetical protein